MYVPHLLFREPAQGVPHYKRGVNRPHSLKEVTPEGRAPAGLAQGVVSGHSCCEECIWGGGFYPPVAAVGGEQLLGEGMSLMAVSA